MRKYHTKAPHSQEGLPSLASLTPPVCLCLRRDLLVDGTHALALAVGR